ncbi:MAG: DUF4331 domain-containing protein [Bacteroidia bacterium]
MLGVSVMLASSHREAPLIADDPLADNTDLYAFRSPDDTNTVTIIANYVPLQLPHGGPNYYQFGEDIRYEIHIDNDISTTGDDIIYRFTFTKVNNDPTTFFNIRLGQENLKTTYNLERTVDGGATWQTIVSNGIVPPPNIGERSIGAPGVGLGTTYQNLFTSAINTSSTGEQVFCGPADDPFFVDLGGVFDLGDMPRQNGAPRDGVGCLNVSVIAIKVPISTLQKDGKNVSQAANILDGDFVIGVWASASRKQIKTLSSTASPAYSGNWVQVSRIGMPLTNEAVIPIGAKDEWNARTPYNENPAHYEYFFNPELGLYMDDSLFGGAVPAFGPLRIQRNSLQAFDFGNGQDGLFGLKGSAAVAGTALDDAVFGTLLLPGAGKPRSVDLWPAFHTGVPNVPPYQLATGKAGNPLAVGKPFVNNFLPNGGDMLRLNMAVPVTQRNDPAFSSLGLINAAVLGLTDPAYASSSALQWIPNMDGFPNGRRLEDDVTRIELQAVSGVVLAAIGLWYDDYTAGAANPVTQDLLDVLTYSTGVDANDTTFRSSFPYVQLPWSGTGKCGGEVVMYNQPSILEPTAFVDQVCDLQSFAPSTFSIFLNGITGAPTHFYTFDANGGTLTTYDDGTARIMGRVENDGNPNYAWDVDVWLVNKRNWTDWSALGRGYKGTDPSAAANHMSWDYYEIDGARAMFVGSGSAVSGDTLFLTHKPTNFYHGFQIGVGANDKNANVGASAWFTFGGAYSGYGDFNFTTSCQSLKPRIQAKVMLAGAYDPVSGRMQNQLNSTGALPLLQPYNQGGYSYTGFEPVAQIPSPDVVDWVLVQLRDPQNLRTVIAEKAAFVTKDGDLMALDGSMGVEIDPGAAASCHIVICHRNHLDVMSAQAVAVNPVMTVDFTQISNVYRDQNLTNLPVTQLGQNGTYGLIKGDADENGTLDQQDVARIVGAYFSRGNTAEDVDMNGVTNASDAQKSYSTQPVSSHVPQ